MDRHESSNSEEIYLVLDETLPIVHRTLVGYYEFTEADAEAFGDTLCVWFHRVSRRSGARFLSADTLREQLLFVACKYARAFQVARYRYETLSEDLSRALNRPSEEVAIELLTRVQRQGVPS
jgi:hypothetical protein